MVLALSVATPVLDLSARASAGRVLGRGGTTAYIDFGGTVVALTWSGLPRLPTAVDIAAPLPPWPPDRRRARPGVAPDRPHGDHLGSGGSARVGSTRRRHEREP